MKIAAFALITFVLVPNVHAADQCSWGIDPVSRSTRRVTPTEVKSLPESSNAREIVSKLGPAARDAGSGLYVLEWDMSDGRIFSVTATRARDVPIATRVMSQKSKLQGDEGMKETEPAKK